MPRVLKTNNMKNHGLLPLRAACHMDKNFQNSSHVMTITNTGMHQSGRLYSIITELYH